MPESYEQLIHRLLNVNIHDGMRLGLTNCLKLNSALGNPAGHIPTIHVAGTNGKGSVCTKIAAGLKAGGLRVGLYTSPHISCFRERIRVNGLMISEEAVQKHLSQIFSLIDSQHIPATFFEISTLLAFSHFSEQNLDAAVIETGLGGRLDATNITTPKLAVITSISLEHTDILGSTLAEITCEKAGIIKPGIPVIVGPRVPIEVIEGIAKTRGSPVIQVAGDFADYHAENKAIARKALEQLEMPPKAIEEGLDALPSCRMEIFYAQQLSPKLCQNLPKAVVLDVAHNPDGLHNLLKAIRQQFHGAKLRFVIGLSASKDISGCIEVIKDAATHFHLVTATNGRAIPKEQLMETMQHKGIPKNKITAEDNVEKGIKNACQQAAINHEMLIVCGSFFIMSEARYTLGIIEPRDPQDLNERHNQKTS